MSGGRTFPAIVVENFTVLTKRSDKSNRYELKCNHCSTVIINRDNNHIKHIADARKCPGAPSENRQRALIYLAGKNVNNDIVMSAPALQTQGSDGPDNASTSQAGASKVIPKKRTRETLAGMVDFPLTDHQKQRANIKLFRFLVHMNLPFRLSENWFFQDFLRDLRPLYTQSEAGVNVELVDELTDGFTWEPPLTANSASDELAGPEDVTPDDIDKAFDDLDAQLREERQNAVATGAAEDGNEILEGNVYDLAELDVIERGQIPANATEDLSIIGDAGGIGWDVEAMMVSKGVV